jgi:hypothetical protein
VLVTGGIQKFEILNDNIKIPSSRKDAKADRKDSDSDSRESNRENLAESLLQAPLTDTALPRNGTIYIDFMRVDQMDQAAEEQGSVVGGPAPVHDFRKALTSLTLIKEATLGFEDTSLFKSLLLANEKETHQSQKLKYTESVDTNYVDSDDMTSFQSTSEAFDNSLKRTVYSQSVKMAAESAHHMIKASRRDSCIQDPFVEFPSVFELYDIEPSRIGCESGATGPQSLPFVKGLKGETERRNPDCVQLWEQFLVRDTFADQVIAPASASSASADKEVPDSKQRRKSTKEK